MRRFVRPPLVCLRPIEQRSRPIVLTPTRRRNAGTGDLYPFQNAAFKKAHSYQRNTAPALSGLPPDPAPPLRPHSQSSKLCETAELAAAPAWLLGAVM